MLLGSIDLLQQDPLEFLRLLMMVAISLTIAITVHEFSHAFTAHRLGDDTAKRLGRVSLNPMVHLDPMGTLLLFLVGFGWGKPVPVNPLYLRHPAKWSMAAVSFSGAFANIITAAFVGLLTRFTLNAWPDVLIELLKYVVVLNLVLAFFNLIPVPPLDGS
ncbi:MAG: site-2 protease family protein, partial [Chloroflexota bacterium]